MNKILSTIVFSIFFIGNVSAASYNVTGLFTFYDPENSIVTSGSITGLYDNESNTMSLSGNTDLTGDWTADGNIITTPGTYNVDTILSNTITGIEVGAEQWLGSLFLDYLGNTNIDTIQVWDITNNLDGSISLSSIDVISDALPTGSGAPGHPSISGPTTGFIYTYDALLTPTAVPVPAAVWLFVSGIISLVGVAKREQAVT